MWIEVPASGDRADDGDDTVFMIDVADWVSDAMVGDGFAIGVRCFGNAAASWR